MESQHQTGHGSGRFRESIGRSSGRHSRPRIPSTSGYMVAASATAGALFFLLWWMLQGEENPWVPAGLAASVVMLVAVAAREAVVRRAWTRYMLEHDGGSAPRSSRLSRSSGRSSGISASTSTWRKLQRQAAEVDASDALPQAHREIYELCSEYLASSEETLRASDLPAENRLAVRATQDRARALQRHHLLIWARDSARSLTREAQQRMRLHEKIEVANRALECIDSALQIYPDEVELNQSADAVREFITSSRVAHWVELAERAAFKGHYRRAIDCYRDALFYLTRDDTHHLHEGTADRISREIELLRARVETDSAPAINHRARKK